MRSEHPGPEFFSDRSELFRSHGVSDIDQSRYAGLVDATKQTAFRSKTAGK
jgi:hypothetical protein